MSSLRRIMIKLIIASKNEITDIVALNAYVQKIHHRAHPAIFKPAADDESIYRFFSHLIDQEKNRFLLAYLDSTAVGYAWYGFEEKPDFPMKHSRRQIYIHQFVVHEAYRRRSVGHSLFEAIKRQGHDQGIHHIELDTWKFNSEALAFFNKMGFEVYNMNMWLDSDGRL